MNRRVLLPLLLPMILLVGGCAQARETAGTVRDCAGLAADVARTGLSGVPSQADAEQAVQRLDDRIKGLESTTVRDAATALRDRLQELQRAAGDADPAAAQRAIEATRDAARNAAQACGLPADQFVQ